MADVNRIEFVFHVGGRKLKAVFVRQEKVADLLSDTGSLGEFLRGYVQFWAERGPLPTSPFDPDLDKNSPEDDDTSEFDDLWDLPPFTAAVAELSRALGTPGDLYRSSLRGLPLALALLLAASNKALDDGQDEFEVLKAARAAFKRALAQRQGSGH